MRKAAILLSAMFGASLLFAGATLEATSASQVTLCTILEDGKTQTVTVSERAATRLESQGAWEGACQLERAARLEGRVTDLAGHPLRGVCVNVLSNDNASNVTKTNRSGSYRIYVPFGGEARLLFNDLNVARQFEPQEAFDKCFEAPLRDYVPEYYQDVPGPGHDFRDAEPIPIAEGGRVTGLDAALARFGTISGRVTDETTGLPLENICVSTELLPTEIATVTGTDGTYTVPNVVPGTAHLIFGSECGPPTPGRTTYFPEWYNNKPDEASADPINVGDGENVTINEAALRRRGSISGFVTDAETGLPIDGTIVVVYDHSTQDVVRVVQIFSTDGSYSAGVDASGEYDVEFGAFGYIGELYDDNPVTVTVGTDTPGINGALTPEP